MVRLHAQVCPARGRTRGLTRGQREAEVDGIWRFVAEAKKQGIYVDHLPLLVATAPTAARWGIPGQVRPGRRSTALLFFDATLQRGVPGPGPPPCSPGPILIPRSRSPGSRPWRSSRCRTRTASCSGPPMGLMKPVQQADRLALGSSRAWLEAEVRLAREGQARPGKGASKGGDKGGDDLAKPARSPSLGTSTPMTVPRKPGPAGRRAADQVAFYAARPSASSTTMIAAGSTARISAASQLINASNWRGGQPRPTLDGHRSAGRTRGLDVDRGEPLLQRRLARRGSTAGWRIEPGDTFTQTLGPCSIPRELLDQPQAGRRPPDDRHRRAPGCHAAGLPVRGAVPRLGLPSR